MDLVGGKKKRSSSKKSSKGEYKKTAAKYVGRDGVKRTIYEKDGKMYVHKRSKKTLKMRWQRIKMTCSSA
jgi:hypothetical protein